MIKTLFGEKVIVELVKEKQEAGGIYFPKENDVLLGKVLKVGDGVKNISTKTVVMFPANSKVEINLDGKSLYVVRVNDLIGVVD